MVKFNVNDVFVLVPENRKYNSEKVAQKIYKDIYKIKLEKNNPRNDVGVSDFSFKYFDDKNVEKSGFVEIKTGELGLSKSQMLWLDKNDPKEYDVLYVNFISSKDLDFTEKDIKNEDECKYAVDRTFDFKNRNI